jgi:hypothetical protein
MYWDTKHPSMPNLCNEKYIDISFADNFLMSTVSHKKYGRL